MTLNRNWEDLWTFDEKLFTLTTTAGNYAYEMELDRLTDNGKILDFIVQIARKTWASPELVGTLVYALDDLLHLQSNFCSWGSTQRVSKSEIPSIVRSQVARIHGGERDDDSFRRRGRRCEEGNAIPAGSEAGSEAVIIWLSAVKGQEQP